MSYHEHSRKTFVAAAVITRDSLVKLTAAGVELCTVGDVPLGVTEVGAKAVGDHVGVRLLNTPGTVEVVSSGVVSIGQLLSSGTDGTVVPRTESSPIVGMALQDTVSGGLVEMMPLFNPAPSV